MIMYKHIYNYLTISIINQNIMMSIKKDIQSNHNYQLKNSKSKKYPKFSPFKQIGITLEEEQRYELDKFNYYKNKDKGKYKLAKLLCEHTYSKCNTNYLGDEMDSIIINNKMLEECNHTDYNKYIRSYEYMYQNVSNIKIEMNIFGTSSINNFNGPEARHILENMKIPDYTKKHTLSYTDYFKSFIMRDIVPLSHQESSMSKDISIKNIWIHTEDTIINFYVTKSGRCEYKYIIV
jgi:hypothetical protein